MRIHLLIIFCLVSWSRITRADCVSPAGVAGQMIYTAATFQYCNGTVWKSVKGTVITTCTAPEAGNLTFAGGTFRFCDGTNIYISKSFNLGGCAVGDTGKMTFAGGKMQFCDGTSQFDMTRDPCLDTPALGTVCAGGSIYAGQFDSGKYMVTPGGCTNSATPTCAGGTDTLQKYWRGSTGSNVDIPGVTNVTVLATPSSSAQRGDVTTPLIVAHASTSADSAAAFCDAMVYGGYSDWSLPSKSEMAYIYCHASAVAPSASYPQENPNCTGYGGKTSEITGFASDWYQTSTENSATSASVQSLYSGEQLVSWTKNTLASIRCVRRY